MQVTVQNSGDLERKLEIRIPEEQVSGSVQDRLKGMTKSTRVEGFRPGKVPFKVIESRYGKQVRQEVISQLVQSSFEEALDQEKLKPAGTPSIDELDDQIGQGFSFTASFEVIPEFTLTDIEKLKVEKKSCEVTDDDISNMLNNLRKQQANLVEVERDAGKGDTVVIDFVGKIDGVAFEGGEAENFELELGSNRFIPGFEEGLEGVKANDERELELAFPDEYPKAELAGKACVFSVKVNAVKEPQLPELNDDFFKLYGIDEGGEEAFRVKLRENMVNEAEQRSKNAARDAILDALHEAHDFQLPKIMVQHEAQRLQEQMKSNMQAQGIPTEAFDKAADAFQDEAKKRVSLQLILGEVIKQNQLKADPGKVRQIIEQQARNYDDPSAVINWYYSDSDRLAEVESLALEGEIIEWVLSKAEVTESKLSFDEIMNNGQTESA